jgi:hypothetical protein
VNRAQLEHIIRASAGNADADDIVVIGSQAILGTFPDAPAELLESMEADVFPRDRPHDSILIDGGIGELSPFHATFGYYAHGVDETTATLPDGWRERLVPVHNENTPAPPAGASKSTTSQSASSSLAARRTSRSSPRSFATSSRHRKSCATASRRHRCPKPPVS